MALLILSYCSSVAAVLSIMQPESYHSVSTQELTYRIVDGRALRALVFRPSGVGHYPAIICLHGGAWVSGDRTLPSYMAQRLAARGFVVMSIDFRMGPSHRYPSSLRDVNYAIRWLRKHAAEYNVDASQVGGLGFSSGGHLVLLSAMRPEYAEYISDIPNELLNCSAMLDWVVTCSGVLDPLARYNMAKQAGYADIIACHDTYFGSEANMQEGNPPLMLERGEAVCLPPLLMFQGGADPRLPSDMAERTADLYRMAGGTAEALIYPSLGHALSEWPSLQQDEVADQILAFASEV